VRHIVGSLVALSCLMSACALTPSQATRATGKATVKPKAKPSVAAASTRPEASAVPRLPEGPTVRLTGKVEVDAHYLLANNAGTLVANNGGSAIVLKGGTLISDNGLGLIANNGLGLISNNGLGLIANNSAGYRTLSTDVAVGTVLPVKGMAVLPVSMRTGELVGKPVFTDAQGGYSVDVPESLKGSLRLVARVPVSKQDDPIAQDPRMQYNLVVETKAAAKASQLDEDSALVTKYLRACVANTIKESMLTEDVPATTERFIKWLKAPELVINALKGMISDLNTAGQAINAKDLSEAELDRIAQRVTDVLLSYIALDTLEVDPVALKRDHVEGATREFAIPAMVDVLKQVRNGAKAKMTADPLHFDSHPMIMAAKKPYQIRKPSDLGDFVVEEIMLSLVDRYDDLKDLFTSIDVPRHQAYRLNTLSLAILTTVGQTMLTSSDAKATMVATIKNTGKPATK
jgi:hypothetical protein